MGRNGDGEGTLSVPECCMCGDYGLSSELFRCKDCRFRFQHKYCSNQYPEAQSYDICNWCLSEKNKGIGEIDTKMSPNSSSTSHPNQIENHEIKTMNKSKRVLGRHKGLGSIKITSSKNKTKNGNTTAPTADRPTPPAGKKRIVAVVNRGGINNSDRIIRRTRSEKVSNGGTIIKQVFRNKIRRYKLLDEVSS